MVTKNYQCVGRSQPFVTVQSPPIIAQRAPASSDIDYAKGQVWLDESASPAALYTHIGGGTWDQGGNSIATTTTPGIVTINTDGTLAGADNTTVPTSLATKTYADALAIAGAPVSTEAVAGIGELATDAEAVAGTASTPAKALFVTPSNLAPVFAAPSAIGGTTPAAGTFTSLTSNGTGTVSLGANAASDFSVTGAGIDLTLDSAAGRVIINGGEAANNAITITSDDAAGGIDINGGSAGITVDSTGAISIDAAGASNFSTSSGDLTLASSAGSVNITAGENAADSIVLTSSAGGIDITAAGGAGEDIDITNTAGSIILTAGEGVADSIRLNASSGGFDFDAAGQINIASSQNAASSIVITSSAGGIDITAAAAAAGEDIDITATGSSINLVSTEDAFQAIYLHANGGTNESIDIRADQGLSETSVYVRSDVGGITIAAGQASADAINIIASNAAGGIDIDSGTAGFIVDTTGSISLDATAASNFTATGAFDITVQSTAGSILLNAGEAAADALNFDSTGGLDVDVALQMNLDSSQAAATAVRIVASNAAGGIDIDSGTGGITIDSTGVLSLDSAGATNLTATGAFDITVNSTAGSVILKGEEAVDDAIQLTSLAGGLAASLAKSCVIASTETNADSVQLTSAGGMDLTATGAAGKDVDIACTNGSVNISSGEAAVDALRLNASAGGIDIDAAGSAGVDIIVTNTGGSLELDATESISDAVRIKASGAAGGISLQAGTGGITSTSGRKINVTAKTNADSPYTVLGTDHYLTGNTVGGVLTFTLPAAPTTGRELYIYDVGGAAGANNITVNGNGNNIAMSGSSAATKALAANFSSMHLVYNGTIWMGRYTA